MDLLNPDTISATFFGNDELPRFACEPAACDSKRKKKCCKKYKRQKRCKSCPKR